MKIMELTLKLTLVLFLMLFLFGCSAERVEINRLSMLPDDIVKGTPQNDEYPPILHSHEYETPVPFDEVNTVGAEDSPFWYKGKLYFFFTPDVRVPVEKQVADGVTGIYVYSGDTGGTVERVWLQEPGKLALDGCAFVQRSKQGTDEIYFCTAREGYTGLHWFKATKNPGAGEFEDWEPAKFDRQKIGEMHMHDGTLYFERDGDIWQSKSGVEAKLWFNTEEPEAMPALNPEGDELWFNRQVNGTPAIFRSKKEGDLWVKPELMISQFAGEPTVSDDGDLYFVHHYYKDGNITEADIYMAKKK